MTTFTGIIKRTCMYRNPWRYTLYLWQRQ